MPQVIPSFFLLVWSLLVSSCSSYVNFIYPNSTDTGMTFNYIDTVYFTWTSSVVGPWMNLWCAPNQTSPQSKLQVYHAQVSTNGTNPQSFPYSEYDKNGACHMQIEDFAGEDWANSPGFSITSNDAAEPQTWGLSALASLGGSSSATAIASLTTSLTTTFSSTVTTAALTSSLSSSPSPSSSASSSSSSSSSSSPSTSSPPPTPTLSKAAKAGISIGSIFCALALIIILLIIRMVWLRRTQEQLHNPNSSKPSSEHMDKERAELVGIIPLYELHGAARPRELQGTPRAELEAMS